MAKILLVEDDTNLSEIYQARMEAEGYSVVAAPDGESALALAAKEKPDLIISDVMMPKISGFEMLDILRNTDGLKHTRVIMLTALGQAEDRSRAESLGADKYLVKSQVTLEDIVTAAQELLGDGVPLQGTELPAAGQPMAQNVGQPAAAAAAPVNPSPAVAAPTGPLAATTAAPLPTGTANPTVVATPAASAFTVTPMQPVGYDAAAATSALPVVPVAQPPQPQPVAATTNNATPVTDPAATAAAWPPAFQPPVQADPAVPAATAAGSQDDSFPKAPASEGADAYAVPFGAAPLTEPLPAVTVPLPAPAEVPASPLTAPVIPDVPTGGLHIPGLALAPAPEPTPPLPATSFTPPAIPANQIMPQTAPPLESQPAEAAAANPPAAEAPGMAMDEHTVASAIDKLLATPVPAGPANGQAVSLPPASPAAPSDVAPPSIINEDFKPRERVITPPEHQPIPTLQELLAIEAAKDATPPPATAPAASPGYPRPPANATLQDADVAATLAQAREDALRHPKPKSTDFDPNSISL